MRTDIQPMRTDNYIQLGPSCGLDEHGDPKPPKYIKVDGWVNDDKPFSGWVADKPYVRRIGKPKPKPERR